MTTSTTTTTTRKGMPSWLKKLLPIVLGALGGLFVWPTLIEKAMLWDGFENAPQYFPRLAIVILAGVGAYAFFESLKAKKVATLIFLVFFTAGAFVSDDYLTAKFAGMFQPATTTATGSPTPIPSPATGATGAPSGAATGAPSGTPWSSLPGGTRVP